MPCDTLQPFHNMLSVNKCKCQQKIQTPQHCTVPEEVANDGTVGVAAPYHPPACRHLAGETQNCFWEFGNPNWKWNAQWNKLNEMNPFSQNKKVNLVKIKVIKNKIKVAFLYQTQNLWPPVDIFFSMNSSNSNYIFIPMQSLGHLLGILKEVAISSLIPYSRSLLLCCIPYYCSNYD